MAGTVIRGISSCHVDTAVYHHGLLVHASCGGVTGKSTDGVPERAVEGRGVLGGVGHDQRVHVAVAFEGRRVTYGELNERANRLARFLCSHGVGPETAVGICMERSPEVVATVLAVLKAGGGYVPLDPAYSADAKERQNRHRQDDDPHSAEPVCERAPE